MLVANQSAGKSNNEPNNHKADLKRVPSASEKEIRLSVKEKRCLVGGLICALLVPVAIIVPLLLTYKSQSNNSPNNSSTAVFLSRWNLTAVTVAGVTITPGVASNLLQYPLSVQVDSSYAVYVVDGNNHRVQKWAVNAVSGTTVAGQANAANGVSLNFLNYPTDLALDASNNVYVLDGGNARVVFWAVGASTGVLVAGNGTVGSALNELSTPLGLARDASSGTLYISDSGNHRVMRYVVGATSGTVVAGGNGAGTATTQLSNPRGLLYDTSTNSVIIANNGGHNIVRWVIGASTWTIIAGSTAGTPGSTSILLSYPTDVVMDSMGNIYVSDEGNQRIQFFLAGQSNGTTVAGVTGSSGSTNTLLNVPSGLTIDNLYNIYVVDWNNARVQKFFNF